MLASLEGIDPKDLPKWLKDQIDLRTDVAEWPLRAFDVRRFGAYGATRNSAKEGACGSKDPIGEQKLLDEASTQDERDAIIAKRYPCKHWGADLSAPAGAKVFAPKDGWILYDGPATDSPFKGYGPWCVLIAHADAAASMWQRVKQWAFGPMLDMNDFPEATVSVSYSMIAHLESKPGTGAPDVKLPGDIWKSLNPPVITRGSRAAAHWGGIRVRDTQGRLVDAGSAMTTGADAYDDPKDTGGRRASRRVFAGEEIGHVSKANHIHWEIRNSPLASNLGRYDPISWARAGYGLMLPAGANVVASPSDGGGGGILLLLALLLLGDKRGRR